MRILSVLILSAFVFPFTIMNAGEKLSPEQDYKCRRYLWEGANLLAEGKTAQALARFKTAQKEAPENAECYYWIGLAHSDLQDYGVAVKNARKALILNPRLSKAMLLLGQSLLYLGKYEEARDILEKAFRLDPHNYLIAFNLGRCYYYGFDAKRKDLALTYFRKALSLNKNFVAATYYMGLCQYDLDILPLARVSFNEVVRKQPRNSDARYRLGMTLRMDNHIQKAIKEFQEAVAADPKNYEAHLQLAHIYLVDMPNRERFLRHIRLFVRLAPNDHPWKKRALMLLQKDRSRTSKKQP